VGPGAGERVRLSRAYDPRRARLRALLVAGFAAWEGRAAAPMLPLRLLRIRDFTAANATALLMTGAPGAACSVSRSTVSSRSATRRWAPAAHPPLNGSPLLIAPAARRISDRGGRRPALAGA